MGDPVVHFEVMALEGAALRQFYSSLFGWTIHVDNPIGYGVITHSENHSAGGVGIGGGIYGDMPAGQDGVTVYVAVDDVEATLRRVVELGGNRLAGPQSVEGGPTFGHLTDPEGHWIGLFENAGLGDAAQLPPDAPAAGTPVVHFEIVGRDLAAMTEFYSSLFGWDIEVSGPAGYGVVDRERNLGDRGVGIGGGIMALPDGVAVDYPGHVTFYVEVPDVGATMSRVEAFGGQGMVGPESLPDGPVIGQIADPEGHVIGLVQAGTL